MAIDIFVQPDREMEFRAEQSTHIVALDDDGYYWFLEPLFQKLSVQTGQYIDLYGYATFGGGDLTTLARTITTARDLAKAQPNQWDVMVGEQVEPSRKEIKEPVNQQEMLSLLDKLQAALEEARERQGYVVFWGD